jgi:hypothetical protein
VVNPTASGRQDIRWHPHDILATTHIASEYAPLLAWEKVLGHAGLLADTASAVVAALSRDRLG